MSDPKELRSTGLKVTAPRLRVLDLFQTSPERHLTAEDVYRRLLDEHADIGLATVYRVLTQFEQAGLLVRHHFEGGKAVYELNEGKHHDHLVCLQCGKVEEFYDPEIEKRQAKIARERGFAIHDHSLYLYADCLKAGLPRPPEERMRPGRARGRCACACARWPPLVALRARPAAPRAVRAVPGRRRDRRGAAAEGGARHARARSRRAGPSLRQGRRRLRQPRGRACRSRSAATIANTR